MAATKRETISTAEFERRLDASNARTAAELTQREDAQAKAERLLTQYEQTLDAIEADEASAVESWAYPALLRTRLLELANKTAEVAASL